MSKMEYSPFFVPDTTGSLKILYPDVNFKDSRSLVNFACSDMVSGDFWDKLFQLLERGLPIHAHMIRLSEFQFYPYGSIPTCQCCSTKSEKMKKWYRSFVFSESNVYPSASSCKAVHLNFEPFLFPQIHLTEKFQKFLVDNKRFLPASIPQKIEEYRRMYEKIVAAEDDDIKWFEVLEEAKDHQFLCDNVEYRLGKKLDNKPLWKLYIGYLKKDSRVEPLLHAYSKYCRVFKNDKNAYDEYQRLAQANPGFSVPWATPFAFETYDPDFFVFSVEQLPTLRCQCRLNYKNCGNEESSRCSKCDYDIAQGWMPFPRSNGMHISFQEFADSAIQQVFSLPAPTIKYMRENAPAEILQKLYECCKIFYVRSPKTLCYKMEVVKDVPRKCYGTERPNGFNKCGVYGNSIKIEDINVEKLKHVYVSKEFSFQYASNRYLSILLENMDSFAAEDISIEIGSITRKQIHLLLKHCLVQHLHLRINKFMPLPSRAADYQVTEPPFGDPDFVVDDLLPYLTNAKSIRLVGIQCTKKTSKMLAEMKFKNKIEGFALAGLNSTDLEPVDFAKFLLKNCSKNANVFWQFNSGVDRAYQTSFFDAAREHLKQNFVGDEETKEFLDIWNDGNGSTYSYQC